MSDQQARAARGYDLEPTETDSEREGALRWPGRRTLVDVEVERWGGADLGDRGEAATGALADEPGRPLPEGARGELERGFGVSLGHVRVHDGPASARAARDMRALAFASGSDIHFGAGELDSGSAAGRRLLAHEVAHTLQSGGARAALSGGPAPGSHPGEREADRAAATVLAGGRASVQASAGPARIHAFQPHEHAGIGDDAGGGDLDLELDDGSTLTFGEMTALADYIGSLDEIRSLAENPAGQLRIRWTLWFARVRGGDEPAFPGKDQARKDWYAELADNADHFGAEGQTAYENEHAQALVDSYFEAYEGAGGGGGARAREAFAHHYLNDLFAAGHIRTPRREIQDYYDARFPSSGTQILETMVSFIADRLENETTLGKVLGGLSSAAEDAVRAQIQSKAGGVLSSMTLGHIIAGAWHDADNKGLGVISDCDPSGAMVPGGYKWTAMGDAKLKTAEAAITRQMAVAAAQASLQELDTILSYGQSDACSGPALTRDEIFAKAEEEVALMQPFAALSYVPRPDPDAGNTEYDYDWEHNDSAMRGAIDAYLKGTIHGQLVQFAGEIPETMDHDGTTLHPRQHFQAFCDHLAAVGVGVLDGAVPVYRPYNPADDGAGM
ncbi:MAG: DUF4157 domain-containing protein [Deltaproteobacteria bacterium]|nr:DUF4157 domain-containing protein [Deltaproteobacteria bacterium]